MRQAHPAQAKPRGTRRFSLAQSLLKLGKTLPQFGKFAVFKCDQPLLIALDLLKLANPASQFAQLLLSGGKAFAAALEIGAQALNLGVTRWHPAASANGQRPGLLPSGRQNRQAVFRARTLRARALARLLAGRGRRGRLDRRREPRRRRHAATGTPGFTVLGDATPGLAAIDRPHLLRRGDAQHDTTPQKIDISIDKSRRVGLEDRDQHLLNIDLRRPGRKRDLPQRFACCHRSVFAAARRRERLRRLRPHRAWRWLGSRGGFAPRRRRRRWRDRPARLLSRGSDGFTRRRGQGFLHSSRAHRWHLGHGRNGQRRVEQDDELFQHPPLAPLRIHQEREDGLAHRLTRPNADGGTTLAVPLDREFHSDRYRLAPQAQTRIVLATGELHDQGRKLFFVGGG